MKVAIACLLVLVAMATVEAGPMKKRFLIKEIQNAINSVGDWFTKTYNSAKDSFNKLASGSEPGVIFAICILLSCRRQNMLGSGSVYTSLF